MRTVYMSKINSELKRELDFEQQIERLPKGLDLIIALRNNGKIGNLKKFSETFSVFPLDPNGYIMDYLNGYFYVTRQDGLIGILHSSGVYVFVDRTIEPWMEEQKYKN